MLRSTQFFVDLNLPKYHPRSSSPSERKAFFDSFANALVAIAEFDLKHLSVLQILKSHYHCLLLKNPVPGEYHNPKIYKVQNLTISIVDIQKQVVRLDISMNIIVLIDRRESQICFCNIESSLFTG
ncbi:hypothetical protein V6N13_074928 [Hibiscus sabdariffa]|uniref:Uncharacterized protein n=1 Tax=Hibiscus sabdariffa TaxID=183260 RepID=A0ABR2UAN4_9ROSI